MKNQEIFVETRIQQKEEANERQQQHSYPVHTLILTRHGDSIWNGGEPGIEETFT
jgi:hypothetical protein